MRAINPALDRDPDLNPRRCIDNDQEQDHEQEQESRLLIFTELQEHVIGSRGSVRTLGYKSVSSPAYGSILRGPIPLRGVPC